MRAIKYLLGSLLIAATLYGVGNLLKAVLLMYQNDTLRDNPASLVYLESQAKEGDVNAAYLLASAYYNGKAGSVDIQKAFYWYKKSADLGDSDAMLMLGWLYYKDPRNIEANTKKARYWFRMAASKGVDEAAEMLELLNQ